jgi:hypothetical protein
VEAYGEKSILNNHFNFIFKLVDVAYSTRIKLSIIDSRLNDFAFSNIEDSPTIPIGNLGSNDKQGIVYLFQLNFSP